MSAAVRGDLTLADLLPGDIMFGPIGGFIPGVFPVGAGQVALAWRSHASLGWRKWWKIRHTGMVVAGAPDGAARPRLVQAMPSGAELVPMMPKRFWTNQYVYLRPRYQKSTLLAERADWHSGNQAMDAAHAAYGYVDTPYNFLTYGKLAAGALRFSATEALLRRWISTRRDMMCSQLVDQALADAGFHVFDDGRLPQDVVPAELFRGLLSLPGQWYRPGLLGGLRDNITWNAREVAPR